MSLFLAVFARLIKVLIVLISVVIVLNPLYEHYHLLATLFELVCMSVVLIVQYIVFGSLSPLHLFASHKPYQLS